MQKRAKICQPAPKGRNEVMAITPTRRSFEGQTAIVTGGARGLGLAIARRLSADGCRIILWDLDFPAFDGSEAGFRPLLQQSVNVADLSAVQLGFQDALAAAGSVEILVNNAGINGPIAAAWEYPIESWDRVLAIDL